MYVCMCVCVCGMSHERVLPAGKVRAESQVRLSLMGF